MKYIDKETLLFEDDKITDDLVQKYNVLFDQFRRKIFHIPPYDNNYIEMFKKQYKIEMDGDEFLELRHFVEEDYSDWKKSKIDEELEGGYSFIDLTNIL